MVDDELIVVMRQVCRIVNGGVRRPSRITARLVGFSLEDVNELVSDHVRVELLLFVLQIELHVAVFQFGVQFFFFHVLIVFIERFIYEVERSSLDERRFRMSLRTEIRSAVV